MSYILTIFLGLFLVNSDELTPIHIWLIEFFALAVITCIITFHDEK